MMIVGSCVLDSRLNARVRAEKMDLKEHFTANSLKFTPDKLKIEARLGTA
jgi:hypothetical protein